MNPVLDQFKKAVSRQSKNQIPKTELWIGTKIFSSQGMSDTLENHLRIADRLDNDLVCVPVSDAPMDKPDLGYRYFNGNDLENVVKFFDRPVLALIDGPFQEMVNQIGLMDVLTRWIRDKKQITEIYTALKKKALLQMIDILEYPVAGIVITDDFASDTGPMVAPEDIKTLFTPFYKNAVATANDQGRPLFLHTCGKLDRLVPVIKSWQINGLCAVQSNANDLLNLYNTFDQSIMIMAGIELDMLVSDPIPDKSLQELKNIVSTLNPKNNLILSSSCGIYEVQYLDRIKKIYKIIN